MQRCQASTKSRERPWGWNTCRQMRASPTCRGSRQGRAGGFDQYPGNGGGVAQVHGQLQMRGAEKGVLAGQTANLAGQIRIEGQVLIPDLLVALCADTVQPVAAAACSTAPSAD